MSEWKADVCVAATEHKKEEEENLMYVKSMRKNDCAEHEFKSKKKIFWITHMFKFKINGRIKKIKIQLKQEKS